MAIIKSYTDIEQSKKLAEILPTESADMQWIIDGLGEPFPFPVDDKVNEYEEPCWSLAALLSVLPEYNLQRTDWGNKTEYKIVVTINEDDYASNNYDNPVDVCYDMISKLYKLKML